MEELELRMYFFVPYNISPIQQAIQAGHAALEYANRFHDTPLFKNFIEKHKTWIILNGGSTNNGLSDGNIGTLNKIYSSIIDFNITARLDDKIDVEKFYEPDLNNTLTAICFICDERVFDFKKYPEQDLFNDILYRDIIEEIDEYTKMIGGLKNIFLRDLIKGKKLA